MKRPSCLRAFVVNLFFASPAQAFDVDGLYPIALPVHGGRVALDADDRYLVIAREHT